jgi:hypothetical protein
MVVIELSKQAETSTAKETFLFLAAYCHDSRECDASFHLYYVSRIHISRGHRVSSDMTSDISGSTVR